MVTVKMCLFVKLRLGLRLSGTQAPKHSGSLRLTQAYSGSLRLLLRLSDSGSYSVTVTQSLG